MALFFPLWILLVAAIPCALLLLLLSALVRPRPVEIPIKGRHVFISGGSSGIGLSLARLAALEGARVSILARNPDKLEEARQSIRLATGVDVAVFSADVRDADAVRRALDEAGPVDVLICNQGLFVARELDLQDVEAVKFMIDVNLTGTFNLIKAALPGMKNRGDRGPGSIALMSSQAGQVGVYGYTAYSASKFGLRGLGEALQQEVIADNIHVSLIFPSDTETPALAEDIKTRSEITRIISNSSGAMKADEVAMITLDGIKSGTFFVTCNFNGIMLALGTAGFSPQRSFFVAFFEVVCAGLMRLIVLYFQWTWYKAIEKWHSQKNSTDTGGSVRVPAAFCGILGLRPSHGRVSTIGVIPMAQSYDTVDEEQILDLDNLSVQKVNHLSDQKIASQPKKSHDLQASTKPTGDFGTSRNTILKRKQHQLV